MLQVPINIATQTGTVSSTAKTLTDLGFSAAQIAAADQLRVSVSGDAIRWRKDGTAPTATTGHYLAANVAPVVIPGNPDVIRFQLIRVTTDATYTVELEGM